MSEIAGDQPATDDYEIFVEELMPSLSVLDRMRSLFLRKQIDLEPHAVIVSVLRTRDGREMFRHIEDGGPDDDHLLAHIQSDLATMTSAEFTARWTSS